MLNRLKAINRYYDVKVINPIPWFPFSIFLERYKNYHRIPKREVIEGIEIYHPRFFTIPRYLKALEVAAFSVSVFPLVLKIKKVFPFDLIDVHWTYPDMFVGQLLAKWTGKKQIITVRGREALYLSERSLRRAMLNKLLKISDGVVCLSTELKEICINLGVRDSNIRVIRNGVDVSTFRFMDKTVCRRKLRMSKTTRVILSVGSLIKGKGHDRIIKALPAIKEIYPDTCLYIAGSHGPAGDYRKEILQLIKRLRLQDDVRFLGQVPNKELVLWYNAADIFCLASRGEGSPNVVNEALACGCPTIATDVGAASEVIARDFLGIMVPNSDDCVASALLSVFSRTYDRKRIATFMRQYDWDWCAMRVMRFYQQILMAS